MLNINFLSYFFSVDTNHSTDLNVRELHSLALFYWDINTLLLSQYLIIIKLTQDTPYITLKCELWSVYCEDLREIWPCYNGTAPYKHTGNYFPSLPHPPYHSEWQLQIAGMSVISSPPTAPSSECSQIAANRNKNNIHIPTVNPRKIPYWKKKTIGYIWEWKHVCSEYFGRKLHIKQGINTNNTWI